MYVSVKDFTKAVKAALCFSDKADEHKDGVCLLADGDVLHVMGCNGCSWVDATTDIREDPIDSPFGLSQANAEALLKILGSRVGLMEMKVEGGQFTCDAGYSCKVHKYENCALAFRKIYLESWGPVEFVVKENGWLVLSSRIMGTFSKALGIMDKDCPVRCQYMAGAPIGKNTILPDTRACAWRFSIEGVQIVSMFTMQKEG